MCARSARPGPDGAARNHDVPARQRPDPHVTGASRAQRDMVPTEEDPEAPARISHPARHRRRPRPRPLGRNAGDVHEQPLAETHRSLPRGSVPLFAEGREVHGLASVHAGAGGSPKPLKAAPSAAAGRNGSPPRSVSTSGISIPTTPTIRPSMACAARESLPALSRAMMSIRSPMTSACRARTSCTTCASRIR
jgi:hypothetical protein